MKFFIIGCQRTGTTLMRLVLESHSRVSCFDEYQSYRALASGDYSVPNGVQRVGFKIPRWTEQLTEPVLLDEGLSERAVNFYRGEPIIFLMRDVRDTVASMLNLKANGITWVEDWGIRILEWKIRAAPSFCARYARHIETWRSSPSVLAAAGALYWKYKSDSYIRYLERGFPVLGVYYEDLVSDPTQALSRVCNFLSIAWEENLLHHPAFPHGELDASGLAIGETNPGRDIHAESVGQWRRILTTADLDAIFSICSLI